MYIAVGAILTWLLQQYRIARSEDAALINEHIKDIEKFCDAAQSYWLNLPTDVNGELAAAAKVRAAHSATTLVYEDMQKICGDQSERYKELCLSLFETATGGSFESSRLSIDAIRAIEVYDLTARLVHTLRTSRKNILSLSYLGKYGVDFRG